MDICIEDAVKIGKYKGENNQTHIFEATVFDQSCEYFIQKNGGESYIDQKGMELLVSNSPHLQGLGGIA